MTWSCDAVHMLARRCRTLMMKNRSTHFWRQRFFFLSFSMTINVWCVQIISMKTSECRGWANTPYSPPSKNSSHISMSLEKKKTQKRKREKKQHTENRTLTLTVIPSPIHSLFFHLSIYLSLSLVSMHSSLKIDYLSGGGWMDIL